MMRKSCKSMKGVIAIIVNNLQDCCGCAACENICKKKAVKMEPDKDGFLYPYIDVGSCVDCRLCRTVCESRTKTSSCSTPLITYAAINKDLSVLKVSSSGGVFAALASIVFQKSGVVFGCTLNKNMNTEHVCIENQEDLYKIQGSKYVQSNIKSSYSEARDYLSTGRVVLFTGTPCQISGFKAYLNREYNNLITADFICHGVPSSTFFKGYIQYLESKLHGHIKDFRFRDKSKGWGSYIGRVTYEKNDTLREKPVSWFTSYYYEYFLKGDILRESCYVCKYATESRQGDFTLGDYWGVEKVHPEVSTSDGVSVLLVNSEKGMALAEELSKIVTLKKSSFEKAKSQNSQLSHPTIKSNKRQVVMQMWRQGGFKAVSRAYQRSHRFQVTIMKLKSIIPKSIKLVIKNLFWNMR